MTLRTIAFIAATLPGLAFAQTFDLEGMRAGLTMLETEIARALARDEFDVDVRELSLNQMVEIANALDEDLDPAIRRQRIEAAVAG